MFLVSCFTALKMGLVLSYRASTGNINYHTPEKIYIEAEILGKDAETYVNNLRRIRTFVRNLILE